MNLAVAQPKFPHDLYVVVFVLGISTLVVLAAAVLIWLMYPKSGGSWKVFAESLPWQVCGLQATCFFLYAAASWDRPTSAAMFVGLWAVVCTIMIIRRHRAQWSLQTLFVITLVVAISCSLLRWQGRPALLLLLAVSWVAMLGIVLVSWLGWCRTPKPADQSEDSDDNTN